MINKKRSKIALFLLAILILTTTTSASLNQPDSRKVGYEYLDNNKVIHFWNEIDDYYLNASSGIQVTNHNNNYWTRNVFCGGVKLANWQFHCNDAIPFAGTISTDNSSYFNMTWQKDITAGQYSIRFKLAYHLGNNDTNLTVNPSIENIGQQAINKDLAFVWKIKDIKIDDNKENDYAYINNSFYQLNQTYNILFKNLSYIEYIDNDTYKEFASYIKLYDDISGRYLRLDWDKSLNYNVSLKSQASQYNSPVTLAINLGTLNVGERKSASLFWIDAGNQFARPDQDVKNPGGYTVSPLYLKIDETSPNDGTTDRINSSLVSGSNPISVNISLSPLFEPIASNNNILRIRIRAVSTKPSTNELNFKAKLFSGNTLVKTYSLNNIGGIFSTKTITLTTAEADLIYLYENLTVQLSATSTGSDINRKKLQVSWTEFEAPDQETSGRQAIEAGINNTIPLSTRHYDQQIYVVNLTNHHKKGKFDVVAILYNQTWAFNHITSGDKYTNVTKLGKIVNIWENQTYSYNEIKRQVELLINATKL